MMMRKYHACACGYQTVTTTLLTSQGDGDLLVDGVEDLDLYGVNDGGDDAAPRLAPLARSSVHQVPPKEREREIESDC